MKKSIISNTTKLWLMPMILLFMLSCSSGSIGTGPEPPIFFDADVRELQFNAFDESIKEIGINSTYEWYYTVSDLALSWVSATKNENKLELSVSENFGGTAREGLITLRSASNELPDIYVTVYQKADQSEYHLMNLSSAVYYGDRYSTGSGYVSMSFADANEPQTHLYIRAFVPLTEDGTTFTLPEGTYTVGDMEQGREMSFVGGYMNSSNQLDGSLCIVRHEDERLSQYMYLMGGTFRVSNENGVCTIRTNFTATDVDTDEIVENLQFLYAGTMLFADRVPTVYEEDCTKMEVLYYGNDYGTSDSAGQYYFYLYTGKTDSNGSLIPPYTRLVAEAYAPLSNGYPPVGTYNCLAAYWRNFTFYPAYVNVGGNLSGTYYEFYGASDPSLPERQVSISGGTIEVSRDGDDYVVKTHLNGLPYYPSQINKAVDVKLTFRGQPRVNDRS